ncbi:flagellar type III secretion system protein FlhB [Rhodobacteraceae bacterium M382]|nr:flagellar type III secretion system protein FlhB [Rhodobacteraceae bacterium M382]
MSGAPDDDSDKTYEPTQQKLQKARDKGEVPKSADLSVAASYFGLLIALAAVGASTVADLGTSLMVLIGQSGELAELIFKGNPGALMGGILSAVMQAIAPWFIAPAVAVLLSVLAQRAMVFAPSKLEFKASRISILSNAKNKFGRSGLFEFFKSFVKLTLYAVCLGFYLNFRLPDIVAAVGVEARSVTALLAQLALEFLFLVAVISACIGGIDAVWQYHEHIRKNRMSRKEMMDEMKEAEGDPHMKQERRQRAQMIAGSQMMADVPDADVVIVNPTHYAVVLKWDRMPGSAPICVAKGVDEVAAVIREIASENGVPIHQDAPTARALHATVAIGQEITEEHYGPVAAAIRFAETMRRKAKESFV